MTQGGTKHEQTFYWKYSLQWKFQKHSHKLTYIVKKTVQFWVTGRIIGHFKQRQKQIVDNLLEAGY